MEGRPGDAPLIEHAECRIENAPRNTAFFKDVAERPVRHRLGQSDAVLDCVRDEGWILGTPLRNPERKVRHLGTRYLLLHQRHSARNYFFELVHILFAEDELLRVICVHMRAHKIDGYAILTAVLNEVGNPTKLCAGRTTHLELRVDLFNCKRRLAIEFEILLLCAGPERNVWFVPDFKFPTAHLWQAVAFYAMVSEGLDHVVPVLPIAG